MTGEDVEVGADGLQARSAYQPTIHQQGNRWIAYIGHHGGSDDIPNPVNPMTGKAEPNGTSIVDVTDPASIAAEVAARMAALPGLGWDAAETGRQVEAYRAAVEATRPGRLSPGSL